MGLVADRAPTHHQVRVATERAGERSRTSVRSYGGAKHPTNHDNGNVQIECVTPVATAPATIERPEVDESTETSPDTPWVVLVWNDPINLMSYVTFVLQKLFGYSLQKATELMLDVHHKGKAVVSSGTREKAEMDVFRLHEHGLWATMQKDGGQKHGGRSDGAS